MNLWSPEDLDAQVADKQCGVGIQLLPSLLRRRGGWFSPPVQPATKMDQHLQKKNAAKKIPLTDNFVGAN